MRSQKNDTLKNAVKLTRDREATLSGAALGVERPWGVVKSLIAVAVFGFALSAPLTLAGCASNGDDDVASSQTHWLKQCSSDAECGDLQCECGVCTTSCDDEQSCSELGGGATCSDTDALSGCGGGTPAQICLQGCVDEECGANSECVADVCVPDSSSADDDDSDEDDSDEDDSDEDDSEDDSSDDAGADDGNSGDDLPPGVNCDDYPSCGVDEDGCEGGVSCIAFAACGGARCIDATEACELSCPDPDVCLIAESYPSQLGCEGKVDANPGAGADDGSADDAANDDGVNDDGATDDSASDDSSSDGGAGSDPAGVNCDNYMACGVGGADCDAGSDCVAIAGCSGAICIPTAEACELSCPDPNECVILESFPLQIGCPGRVDGSGDPANDEVDLSDLNSDCGDDDSCPAGLSAVHFFGIAGPNGPEFCSCSIPCADDSDVCPDGSSCQTIADGPGEVCVQSEPTSEPCGNAICANDEVCCDKCSSQCVDALSGANCPDDADPDRVCSADFACGDELTCEAATQYCQAVAGGPAGSGVSYDCIEFADDCSECACLVDEDDLSTGTSCSETNDGAVTVQVALP